VGEIEDKDCEDEWNKEYQERQKRFDKLLSEAGFCSGCVRKLPDTNSIINLYTHIGIRH
jgi:phosphoglycerate dehydrogenase-like enzyme